MNKIISKERFSEKVFKFEIEAPLIAKSRKADQEALSCANRVCKVKPAALGEQIGDYAALSVAANLTD